ncbi:hypothetical protein [Streptomyces chilikensis]|uniref:Uncharacterized protein n=1 Tax=Streptomyces chilikensis TaxID=1194079 RepID=A0ABV3EJE6_9ACTN
MTTDRDGRAVWSPDVELGDLVVTATPKSSRACTAVVEETAPGRIVLRVWLLPLPDQTATVTAGEGVPVHVTGSHP